MSRIFEKKADFRLIPLVYFREASRQGKKEIVSVLPCLL